MATVNNATTAPYQRSDAIRVVAILYCWFGFALLLSSLLIVFYVLRNGVLPVLFGIDMLAGPFSVRFGIEGVPLAIAMWSVVNLLEVVAGYWLWKGRKQGGKLALMLLPAGAMFWIGYALPVMIVVGPLRVFLLAIGWKTLR
jgi:hypothetical protein